MGKVRPNSWANEGISTLPDTANLKILAPHLVFSILIAVLQFYNYRVAYIISASSMLSKQTISLIDIFFSFSHGL
jgi:hypothetical protein